MSSAADKLEAVFSKIADTRMAGLPICNTSLRVQVVGCREWQGYWLSVLVTPWMINLVLMSGEKEQLSALALDQKVTWEFPSGRYEFMGLIEAELGACHICSLISPVIHIESHEEAVSIAEEAMQELFVSERSDVQRDADNKSMFEAARMQGEPIKDKQLSRRDFLRGSFLGM
jgi:[NiFe] hydrogenase assembly HybE family chaperone